MVHMELFKESFPPSVVDRWLLPQILSQICSLRLSIRQVLKHNHRKNLVYTLRYYKTVLCSVDTRLLYGYRIVENRLYSLQSVTEGRKAKAVTFDYNI